MFKIICTKAETIATHNYCNVISQMQRLEIWHGFKSAIDSY
jgi:hypothetical protein